MRCNNRNNERKKTPEQTAKLYCGSCHLFPEPDLLDETTWKQNVLPPMGTMLGIDYLYQMPLYSGNKNAISVNDWKKILSYYITEAPDKMPEQGRLPWSRVT